MTCFRLPLVLFVCALLGLAACGGDDSGDPGRGSPDAGDVASGCAALCAAKVSECGSPPGGGDPCQPLCASLTTQAELSCLGESSCLELAEQFERGEVPCDGATDTSGECELGDPPRCEGDAVVTCVEIAGMPATSTTRCGTDEACEDGECVSTAMCLPLDARDCDPLNDGIGPDQCCEGTVCFGEIASDGERYERCCVAVDSDDACTDDPDCCGHDPDSPLSPICSDGRCTFSL